MNFYFQIAIPLGKASTRGIILFENISGKGIKTIIQNEINEYIRNDLNLNLGISIKPLATKEYIERLFEKINIKKITFMGFAKDNNNDSALDEDRGVRSFKSSEYTLKSPVIPNIGAKLKKCVNDSKEISKIVEFDDFKYDNIKIDIRNDRNNRTIDLSKLSEVLMYEDITEKVFLLQQINESELLKELSSLCYYYLKEMRLIR
ncbi:hypothetical protein IR152_07290 [Clostridioides sp. ES-S-0108-01]|uniref:hypothetical protein n=1 Tax=Clostridioides sp. ES-S-0108-01 TaxID=2770773 RepID=UPI001D0C24AF|nr:hypothetical protein [Clostridioides sp. ES-S-0108-01]UDN52186.1 hypothetical protein JJC16_05860 [Clostridioides sp. ES-S-0107-01]